MLQTYHLHVAKCQVLDPTDVLYDNLYGGKKPSLSQSQKKPIIQTINVGIENWEILMGEDNNLIDKFA